MNLKPPREDPYSRENKIREELTKRGFGEKLTVIDTKNLADDDGNHYLNEDISVDLIYRHHPEHKGFNFREDYKEEVEFYAVSIEGGKKGYVERRSREDNLDVVDELLANIARSDNLSTHYY
jgi:hypothetical protein